MCLSEAILRSRPSHLGDSAPRVYAYDLDLLDPDIFDCPGYFDFPPENQDFFVSPESVREEVTFWLTCDSIDADLDWLAAEPRHEEELLLRYFNKHVRRVQDVLEFRDMLWECIATVPGHYTVIPLPEFVSEFGAEPVEDDAA